MSLFRVILLICVIPKPFTHAQTIHYNDALSNFFENGLEHQLAEIRADVDLNKMRLFRMLPDPTVHFVTEKVEGSEGRERETSVTIEQELAVLGQQRLRYRIASMGFSVVDLQLEFVRSQLVRDFTRQFQHVQFDQHKYDLLLQTHEAISAAHQSASDRFDEGSISGFELQRFTIELLKHQRVVSEQLNRLRDTKMNLVAQMLGNESSDAMSNDIIDAYSFTGRLESVVPTFNLDQAVSRALSSRADLKALEKSRQTSRYRISLEQRNRFPRLFLEYGYKEISGLGNGYEAGLSLRLPIFSYKTPAVDISRAESRRTDLEYLQKVRSINIELNSVFSRLEALQKEQALLEQQRLDESLLDTALLLYSEGTISLVELLDAVEAHIELEMLKLQFVLELNETLTDFRFVTGALTYQE